MNSVATHTKNSNMFLTQTERVLKRKFFEDSSDGMKVLVSDNSNTLNEYKSTINIKKRYVLAASRRAAELSSTDAVIVKPEITTNSDAQDKAKGQNFSRLAAIDVK